LTERRHAMKKTISRCVSLICVLILMTALMTGCSASTSSPYDGEWAYIHDDATVAVAVKGNKANVDGIQCESTMEGDLLKLKAEDGTIFEIGPSDKDGQIILYKFTKYEYQGEGNPDGLIGDWKSAENWEFEFTDDGTFKEDGYFPGYFTDNKEAGTFTLVYNDHFVDTECKYSIDGNVLTVEYPWPLVKPVK